MIYISKLWNFYKGYVIISLYGFNADKLTEKAVASEIKIYDIHKDGNKYTLKLLPRDFFAFRLLARKYKCRISIIHKDGMFRVCHRACKNIFYPIGIAFALIFIFILTQRVWLIDIEGNTLTDSFYILEYCSKNNLYVGCNKNRVNCRQLADNLKINFKEISWVNVSKKGSRVYIKMSESSEKQVNAINSEPCNIVSNNNCIISSIVTTKGTPQVKANDIVLSGDLLIASQLVQSGTEENPITDMVSAQGTVKGYVTREYSFTVPYNITAKEYTKNTKEIYSIKFINKLFAIKYKPKYENYDKITTIKQLKIGENCPLPIVIYKDLYSEYVYTPKRLTQEEAKKAADTKITEHIVYDYSTDTDIISVKTNFKEDNDKLIVRAVIVSDENIGVKAPIQEEMQ